MKTSKIYLMMFLCLIAVIGCSEDDDAMSSDELTITNISVSVEDSVYITLSGDYKNPRTSLLRMPTIGLYLVLMTVYSLYLRNLARLVITPSQYQLKIIIVLILFVPPRFL